MAPSSDLGDKRPNRLATARAIDDLPADVPPPIHTTRCKPSRVLALQGETREATEDGAIEGRFVLVGGGVVEGSRVVVAKLGQRFRRRLDEVEVLAVALLGLVAPGAIVGVFRRLGLSDQPGLLALEQVELPLDDVLEAARGHHRT